MALIRNIAGLGAVQDFETLKCADPGCTAGDGANGGTFLDDNGPYVYEKVPGSGVFPIVEYPIDPIEKSGGATTTNVVQDVQPPNVVAVGPTTPEPAQKPPVDTVGLLILAAMGVVLMQKESKGFTYPGLYLGGVAALYYHLKK